MRFVVLAVALAGFWFALSGYFKPLLIAVGTASILLCLWVAYRMRTIDEEGIPLQLLGGSITYLPWLLIEIVKSSWSVAQIIIDPRLPISPTMTRVRGSQKTPVGLNVYANSITLTPGTVTTNVAGNDLTVHALIASNADDLEGGDMDRRVTRFEGA
ncbi:MAG: Na+/H+ antiporter subunit E [Pseudomonadota bacterium]